MEHYVQNIRKTIVGIVGMSFRYCYTEFNDPLKHLRVVQEARNNAPPIVTEILKKTKEDFDLLNSKGRGSSSYENASDEIALTCVKILDFYVDWTKILMRTPPQDLCVRVFLAHRIILSKQSIQTFQHYKMKESTKELFITMDATLKGLEIRLIKKQAPIGIVFNP